MLGNSGHGIQVLQGRHTGFPHARRPPFPGAGHFVLWGAPSTRWGRCLLKGAVTVSNCSVKRAQLALGPGD